MADKIIHLRFPKGAEQKPRPTSPVYADLTDQEKQSVTLLTDFSRSARSETTATPARSSTPARVTQKGVFTSEERSALELMIKGYSEEWDISDYSFEATDLESSALKKEVFSVFSHGGQHTLMSFTKTIINGQDQYLLCINPDQTKSGMTDVSFPSLYNKAFRFLNGAESKASIGSPS